MRERGTGYEVVFGDGDLPEVGLFEFGKLADGADDGVGLLPAGEDLLEDGDDVGVVVGLTGEGVDDGGDVDFAGGE